MSAPDLAAIRARVQAATAPWRFREKGAGADLIAAAPSDLAALLALVDEQAAEIARLTAEMLEWRKAMHSLTPGGSEFMTPAACLDWLREMKTGLIEGRIAAERAKQEARATIAALTAAAEGTRADILQAANVMDCQAASGTRVDPERVAERIRALAASLPPPPEET